MTLTQLHYFITISETKSLNKAAEQLYVSQPSLTSAIRELEKELGIEIRVLDYNEHALTSGSGAQDASYIHLMDVKTGKVTYGVGISSNITRASFRGIFSAVNRLFY